MRKTKLYRQHLLQIDTNEPAYVSCGVCCMMMVLHSFHDIPPTTRREESMYRDWRCHATPGVLGATIAHVLSRHRLKVKLVHESPALLENRDRYYPFDAEHPPTGEPYFPEDVFAKILAEHRSYIDRPDSSFDVETGVAITPALLRAELEQNRLVIIQRIMPGDGNERAMHWILLYGCEDDKFLVRDPLAGSRIITTDELAACIDTPFSASYISVGE